MPDLIIFLIVPCESVLQRLKIKLMFHVKMNISWIHTKARNKTCQISKPYGSEYLLGAPLGNGCCLENVTLTSRQRFVKPAPLMEVQ